MSKTQKDPNRWTIYPTDNHAIVICSPQGTVCGDGFPLRPQHRALIERAPELLGKLESLANAVDFADAAYREQLARDALATVKSIRAGE